VQKLEQLPKTTLDRMSADSSPNLIFGGGVLYRVEREETQMFLTLPVEAKWFAHGRAMSYAVMSSSQVLFFPAVSRLCLLPSSPLLSNCICVATSTPLSVRAVQIKEGLHQMGVIKRVHVCGYG